MVPGEGIEPSTLRSSGACSTTELPRHELENSKECSHGTDAGDFVNINQPKLLSVTVSGRITTRLLWHKSQPHPTSKQQTRRQKRENADTQTGYTKS